MGSLYCSWLSSTWQSTTSCSTICQKRLQADHISFRTYLSVRMQSLEECRKNARLSLFYKGLHGLAAVPMHELQHLTRCTRYSGTDTFTAMSSHTDAHKFSFLPRTVTDCKALPASTRSSAGRFCRAVVRIWD